jgi:hypothetical protein
MNNLLIFINTHPFKQTSYTHQQQLGKELQFRPIQVRRYNTIVNSYLQQHLCTYH